MEAAPAANPPLAWDRFDSIPNPVKGLRLSFWPTPEAALARMHDAPPGCRARVVRILRDYGILDRAEAPQYHSPIAAAGA